MDHRNWARVNREIYDTSFCRAANYRVQGGTFEREKQCYIHIHFGLEEKFLSLGRCPGHWGVDPEAR